MRGYEDIIHYVPNLKKTDINLYNALSSANNQLKIIFQNIINDDTTIVDSHANRISTMYDTTKLRVGTFYYEIDTGLLFILSTQATWTSVSIKDIINTPNGPEVLGPLYFGWTSYITPVNLPYIGADQNLGGTTEGQLNLVAGSTAAYPNQNILLQPAGTGWIEVGGPLDVNGIIRSRGKSIPSTFGGAGAEVYYDGAIVFFQGYNRTGGVYLPIQLNGSTININSSTGAVTILAYTTANLTSTNGGVSIAAGTNINATAANQIALTTTNDGSSITLTANSINLSPSSALQINGTPAVASHVVPLRKLNDSTGSNGSMTITNGIITAVVNPT